MPQRSIQTLLGLSLGIMFAASALRAQVIYVDQAATGANNGSSWADAYTSLTSPLNLVQRDIEIWVAKGVYKAGPPGSDRTTAFVIAERGVHVYGGFTNGMSSLTNRNPRLNPTVLSGDFNGDDTANWGNRADNAYNVVRVMSGDVTPTGCILDGFIIRGGNANLGDTTSSSYGGGVYVHNSTSLRISNCVFTDNSADGSGGLLLRRSALAVIENCVFSGNRAATASSHNYGSGAAGIGATAAMNYSVEFKVCRFVGNASAEYGGGFYSTSAVISNAFRNCLFVGNRAAEFGGGLMLRNFPTPIINCTFSKNSPSAIWNQGGAPIATNLILWGDDAELTGFSPALVRSYSDIMGTGGGGTGNIDADPLFMLATSRVWTAAGIFNPANGQTQLTDAQGNWTPMGLVGGTVNPDTTQQLHYYIASNSVQTLYVWGDATAGGIGDTYSLHDWRLQTNSPCVDTGDPGMDWSQEPNFPAGKIDMGAYGNLAPESIDTNPPPEAVAQPLRLIVR